MEILFTAFIKATGWSIINSLWQGSLIYIILLLVFTFNPSIKAKTKHNISFMALAAIFCWFSITFYSEFNFWIELNKSLESYYAPGFTFMSPAVIPPLHISFLEKAEQSFPIIVSLYSLGLLVQLAILFLGYLKVRQLKTKGLSELPEDLLARFTGLKKMVGLSRIVKFKLSVRVNVPMVVGYLKPVVLIPVSILSRLEVQQLEAVIIHELSHIRRNDYMLNLIKISIETILFFNPFVWLCSKLIDTEREHACDDLVLQITGQPLVYASTLLKLEKMKQDQNVFSMAITGNKFHLLNRIKRMTEMKTSTLNFKVQLFSIILLSAVVLSLAWIPVKEDLKEIVKEEEKEISAEAKAFKQATVVSAGLQLADNTTANIALNQPIDPIDTLKNQFKIMVEDESGKQITYNNLEEMPDDLRFEFLDRNRSRFAMPVYHFGNGTKGFNGFTMRPVNDSTRINRIKVNGETVYSTMGFYASDSARVKGYSYFFGDSSLALRDTGLMRKVGKINAYGLGKIDTYGLGMGMNTLSKNQIAHQAWVLDKNNTNKYYNKPNYQAPGTIEERTAAVKKILENKENRERVAKSLLRPVYRMNPQGQLEENLNTVLVFDDVVLTAEDILKVIRPGLTNEYGIYIPTRDEKIRKLIDNPENKDELRKIIAENPPARFGGFSMNGRSIYKFDETLVQKSDIIEYLNKNQKAKQNLLKD